MAVVYEQTPNPNALKFVVSREVRGDKGPLYYKKDPKDNPKQEAPLAYQLFQFEGVVDVFFGSNFITVGKGFKKLQHPHQNFENVELLTHFLKNKPIENAYVLLKGSRGIQLEKLIELNAL